jgi:hypothetical protein
MKIQGKDLQVNQTMKFGNVWVKIEKLVESTFKNGNPKIEIFGTQLKGFVKRDGRKIQTPSIKFETEIKPQTKIEVR